MNAPDVEGFTTRGVTVCSVPVGAVAKLITSRHHVPSQAEWRCTAVLLREEDTWYWTEPMEHWASLPCPTTTFDIEGFSIRYMITVFYDKNKDTNTPTYVHKTKVTEDKKWTAITLTDEGRLCKMDFGGRWRTVDESGTEVRAGSTRPPDIPGDAYEFLRRGKKKDPATSSAAPVTVGVEPGSHPKSKANSYPRIAIDIGGVISKYHPGNSTISDEWFLPRDSEVPRTTLSIRELVKRFGADNVFIISNAGPKMAKLSKAWLLDVMAIEAITGFNPNNIHFCAKISGPRGKGRIAKFLGITHMIDDKDEALLSVYETLQESGVKFPTQGQLFHFARSGNGTHPPS